MVKRLLVSVPIFFVLLLLLLLPTIYRAYRVFSREHVTGFGFVSGSPAENAFRILVLVLIALVAYWISGKLLRTN
jgi:hypothetical protein